MIPFPSRMLFYQQNHANSQAKASWKCPEVFLVRLWKQWCYIIIIIAVIIIINVCAKSLKSLFVIIKKVVVRVSLNINTFQTKFSWCLREKSKLPDSLWSHYRIAIWSRTLRLTSFSHKASLFATHDLQAVSATGTAGHISAGMLMKGCCCLALNDFPETHLIQTYRNCSP